MMKVKLTGFREAEEALSRLPKATAKNVLRRVARQALEPMAGRAAALAPKQSGKLSFSISVSEKRTRRAGGARAKFIAPGVFRSASSDSIVMAMGPAGGLGVLPYAAFVEFGTVDTSPKAFMRPAWDLGKEAALDHVRLSLQSEIDKAVARAARRAAKKAAAKG